MHTIQQDNLPLNAVLQFLWSAALSSGTRQAYETGMKCFRTFIALNSFSVDGSLPVVTENLLLLFVAHCFSVLQLKCSTIKLYLSGVRFCYLQAGVENPLCKEEANLARLHTILRAIKKIQGTSTLRRLPITFNILHLMCQTLRKGAFTPFTNLMLEAAFCVAFFGFLRCGEFTCNTTFNSQINLTIGDVRIISDKSYLTVTLKASKTDPFRQGVTINLFSTGHDICPVTAVSDYLAALPDRSKQPHQPFFQNNQLQPMTRQYFIQHLKIILQRLGLDSGQFSGHSFRIGAATSCSAMGIEDHLIQSLGRWSSDCYIRYIRTPLSSISRAQRRMCGISEYHGVL